MPGQPGSPDQPGHPRQPGNFGQHGQPGHPGQPGQPERAAASDPHDDAQKKRRRRSAAVWAGWGGGLVLALVASGIGIWQVDEHVYSTDAAAENYWEALRAGDGSTALGMFSSVPDLDASSPALPQPLMFPASAEDEDPDDEGSDDEGSADEDDTTDDEGSAEDGSEDADEEDADEDAPAVPDEDRLDPGAVDSVLLDGDALRHSTDQLEDVSIAERGDGADLSFTVDGEPHEAQVPMTREGSIWFFFDDWKLEPEAMTEVDLSIPAAELGGIGQVDVNGQPVNLHEDGATLAAFVPTVLDVDIDSDWLSGSAHDVVADDGEHSLEVELEASDASAQLLQDEVEEYLDSCEEQEVLMPSGCPMGVQTSNSVDADTISWDMPDAEDIALTFDDDGWSVSGHSNLSATVSFESLDHFDGDELDESHDVSFGLDVQVGASGEDLVISVIGD